MSNCLSATTLTLRHVIITTCLFSTTLTMGSETVTYYHVNALGSPVAATDGYGDFVWREAYKPYGERIKQESAAKDNDRWYTGHPHDEDVGLTYMGARYYDPLIGRFMAIDPAPFNETEPQSFNRYAYAINNPYKYIDPNGLEPVGLSLQVGATAFLKGALGVSVYFDKKTWELGAAWTSEGGIGLAGPVPFSAGISLNYIWSTPETELADVDGLSTQVSGSVTFPVLVGVQGASAIPDSSIRFEPKDGGSVGTLADVKLGEKRIYEAGIAAGLPGIEGGIARSNTRLVSTDIIPRIANGAKELLGVPPSQD